MTIKKVKFKQVRTPVDIKVFNKVDVYFRTNHFLIYNYLNIILNCAIYAHRIQWQISDFIGERFMR